jgi:hypothetical protein
VAKRRKDGPRGRPNAISPPQPPWARAEKIGAGGMRI